jgi:hypothetical protein
MNTQPEESMRMAGDLFGTMANYLQLMHTEVIWKVVGGIADGNTPGPNPGKLADYQRLLMMTYRNALTLFEPVRRSCNRPDDCAQDEDCINHECVPPDGSRGSSLRGGDGGCVFPDDCAQDELCIKGECVPKPFPLDWAPPTEAPRAYDAELAAAFRVYYDKILRILLGGLAKHPGKLADVRDLLIKTYVQAAAIGEPTAKLSTCKDGGSCSAGQECIDGACVPVPFRIVFKRFGSN